MFNRLKAFIKARPIVSGAIGVVVLIIVALALSGCEPLLPTIPNPVPGG